MLLFEWIDTPGIEPIKHEQEDHYHQPEIGQATFLLSSEFLLVNFREAEDKGNGRRVGDQDRCHRVKEGNRSGGVLYHGLGSMVRDWRGGWHRVKLLTRLSGAELTCLSNFYPTIGFIPRNVIVLRSIKDLPSEATGEAEYFRHSGLRSKLGIPLRVGGPLRR